MLLRDKRLVFGLGLVAVLLAILVAVILLNPGRGAEDTAVILRNVSECPEVELKLTEIRRDGTVGSTYVITAKPGEETRVRVKPNTVYEYILDFDRGQADEFGNRCFERDTGRIESIPSGRTVTINAASETGPDALPRLTPTP